MLDEVNRGNQRQIGDVCWCILERAVVRVVTGFTGLFDCFGCDIDAHG